MAMQYSSQVKLSYHEILLGHVQNILAIKDSEGKPSKSFEEDMWRAINNLEDALFPYLTEPQNETLLNQLKKIDKIAEAENIDLKNYIITRKRFRILMNTLKGLGILFKREAEAR